MKCKLCGKEFNPVEVDEGDSWDRGDGVIYHKTSWSYKPICPHCGHNNTPSVYYKPMVH